jgi:hypothetical protein
MAMRIDGTTGGQTSLGFNLPNANRVTTPDNATADQSTGDPTTAGQFQAGSDFFPLVSALSGVPQVRQALVGDVAARLSGGELSSPQARQQTVESILGSSAGRG